MQKCYVNRKQTYIGLHARRLSWSSDYMFHPQPDVKVTLRKHIVTKKCLTNNLMSGVPFNSVIVYTDKKLYSGCL